MARKADFPELLHAEQLIAEFFKESAIGLAVFDQQMRYRMLNAYLAASNGTSIESHLGKHVREILADAVGVPVEQAIRQVFAHAKPVLNCELAGALPTKPDGGHWIDTFFPITDSMGKVKEVGAVVVEIPRNVEVQKLVEVEREPSRIFLRSWKDIAQYVGTCVKTVQRWEHAHDLPVRRVEPNKGSVVFALADEIDDWLRNRVVRHNEPNKGVGHR